MPVEIEAHNKSCTMKQMRLLSFLAIANTWKL